MSSPKSPNNPERKTQKSKFKNKMKSPLEAIKTRLRSTSSVPLEKTYDETSIKQLHLISDEEMTMDEISFMPKPWC